MSTRTFGWFVAILALLLLAFVVASDRGGGGFIHWLGTAIHGERGQR